MSTTDPTASEKPTRYLIFDTETVPDGKLLASVKYPGENLSPEEAVRKAQVEARAKSPTGSDFLPVAFQFPVAICVLSLDDTYAIQKLACLDAPQFRTAEMVRIFWTGKEQKHANAMLVTFNGRGFDVPLLELAAFRYGLALRGHFRGSRQRFGGNHLDLLELMTNYNACRLEGGLNLLSKLLGKPGKMDTRGEQVYDMFIEKRLQEINDYCVCDTLDTYFLFLRTRLLVGEITLPQEQEIVAAAKAWLTARAPESPALQKYLANWGDWKPWP